MTKEQEGVKLISFRLCCIVLLSERISLKYVLCFLQTVVKVRTIFCISASRFTQSERHAGNW